MEMRNTNMVIGQSFFRISWMPEAGYNGLFSLVSEVCYCLGWQILTHWNFYALGVSIPGIAGMFGLNILRSGLRQIEKCNVLGFDKWDFFGIRIW